MSLLLTAGKVAGIAFQFLSLSSGRVRCVVLIRLQIRSARLTFDDGLTMSCPIFRYRVVVEKRDRAIQKKVCSRLVLCACVEYKPLKPLCHLF